MAAWSVGLLSVLVLPVAGLTLVADIRVRQALDQSVLVATGEVPVHELIASLDAATDTGPANSGLDRIAAISLLQMSLRSSIDDADSASLLDAALDHTRAGLAVAPSDLELRVLNARVLTALGIQGRVGAFEEAELAYAELREFAPLDATVAIEGVEHLLSRIDLRGETELEPLARTELDRSWSLIPKHNAGSWYAVARAELTLGDQEAALKATRRALNADPGYEPARRLLAELS